MSWVAEIHIGELRPWPSVALVKRGNTDETKAYVPAATAIRRIRSRDGIGRCACSECGGSVGINDRYCRRCGSKLEKGWK